MSQAEFLLGGEFPPARREDWLELVSAALKGAPFEKLAATTHDGLRIEPLYSARRDARPVAGRAPGAAWQILQRIDHPDPAAANEQARHDLANGANGLSLVFAGSLGANGYGAPASDAAIARVFEDVHLDAGIAVELELGAQGEEVARTVASLLQKQGVAPAAVDLRFGLDPLGVMATTGVSAKPWDELAASFADLIKDLARQGFRGPFAVADARSVHAAGGSEAQELAFALASAVAYLRVLERAGVSLEDARQMIFCRLAADADEFLTIAKFRALRRLWARVEAACRLRGEPIFVSAETAWRMMTRCDPWVNLLRATVAVFSAGVAGANAVSVLPFTAALGLPDGFARRIARNTQLVLLEEANLAKVADAAAGSGALEDLTGKLCRAAWTLFQEIEASGGLAAALEQGLIQQPIARVRAERQKAAALREDVLTGVSEFPDIGEVSVSVLDVMPMQLPPLASAAVRFEPLPRVRVSEPYEQLRERSDRLLRDTGSRPKIFLANLGPLAAFTARAMWAKNFFEAGGIEAVTNDGFAGTAAESATDLNALTAAFRSSGAQLACISSSDAIYAKEAEAAARALAKTGARHIYLAGRLAGRPRQMEAALRNSGVKTFIYAGCDVLATLAESYRCLGLV
jgi:methylmalonyl-CoA mutase